MKFEIEMLKGKIKISHDSNVNKKAEAVVEDAQDHAAPATWKGIF